MKTTLEVTWITGTRTAFPNVTLYNETDSVINITFGDCPEDEQSQARIFKDKILFMERIRK